MSRTAVDGTELRCELFYANPNVTHPKFADTLVYDPSGMTITIYNEDICFFQAIECTSNG